jgi:hypothetical protein
VWHMLMSVIRAHARVGVTSVTRWLMGRGHFSTNAQSAHDSPKAVHVLAPQCLQPSPRWHST